MTGLLPPDHPHAPKYWMYETGGKLVPAMQRFIEGRPAEPDDINLIRAYLAQWINSPLWDGGPYAETLDDLRIKVHELHNRHQVDIWLDLALDLGIDPL